jgi:hypothetical protein
MHDCVFENQGLRPPTTLPEFFDICQKLQSSKVTPLALPASGWVLANLRAGVSLLAPS